MSKETSDSAWDAKALGGSWKRKIVNPDLLEERAKCTFDQTELNRLFFDHADYIQQMNELVKEHPELIEGNMERYDMSREENFAFIWKRIKRTMELKPEVLVSDESSKPFIYYFGDAIGPLNLHFAVFTKTIEGLASPEQQEMWLDKARKLNIIGCYAQTELGHGSNVSDLETTATLDMKTDEFVIHTPNVKATKVWAGDITISSHAAVFARLKIEDNDYGVWPFMVPLRNLEDYSPLPGVEVGDLGSKIGFKIMDNGYCVFNNVRIPRTNLFARLIDVQKDGSVALKGNPKIVYSMMLKTRILLA